ncbi:IS630 family transposase [Verminephrobacter eiseniae]|uniref:IS630 family transposase n=3 Tax=Verminephrobacter eiseniae TaxID=364317 RepID=UPI002236F7E5|nr:IS630 family transposase [Verminephrobacter eiseniae]MCW5232220.1 IS630 family transposase [Verminephrobacter eiseniae]MCW5296217.1 IS630 family transposase [Verminephrobacter eiseniae]MCW8226347.1 IS630 family transposase [Verminephrobacter eiseniae]
MQRMGKMNLTDAERDKLLTATRSRTARVADVRRAKLILMLEEGQSRDTIMQRLECDSRFISRWSSRFLSERLAGMYARHPGRAPKQPPAKLEARVLNYTLRRKPSDGSTHWSSYKLSAELGNVSVSAVQRIWRKHNVRAQRLDRHMVSNDPDFETKAADVIGLYLNPPVHAVVFCVDEKTAIQALDRQDRMLPLSPGRAESHGFEYKRNGTLSLFAALNTTTVENWFSRIQRDVITRGVFTSVKDLGRKLMRYIREHNKNPKPIKWKYDDPSRCIRQGLIQ